MITRLKNRPLKENTISGKNTTKRAVNEGPISLKSNIKAFTGLTETKRYTPSSESNGMHDYALNMVGQDVDIKLEKLELNILTNHNMTC